MQSVPLAREGEAPDVETASADYAARFSGPAGRYLLSAQESAVRKLLSSYAGQTLLEVGGGHGQLLPLYASLGMKVTLHGSEPACFERLSGPAFENVDRLVGPYLSLGLPERSFDVVVAIRLVMHEAEWKRLLAVMCRLARKAVIIDYASTRSLNVLGGLLFRLKRHLEGNTRAYLSFNKEDLTRAFRAEGFDRISEQPQLFLPTVLHRTLGANPVLRGIETVAQRTGITSALGSPVILRAEAGSHSEP